MIASDIDFSTVRFFDPHEFPEIQGISILEFTDADLIQALIRFRTQLGRGIVPSPVTAGWVREGGSRRSQHYIGPIRQDADGTATSGRLSTAGDVFPNCDIRKALMTALSIPEFGGIGVYLDTNGPRGVPQPMMHLDIRKGPRQIWMRYQGKYIYPERGQSEMDFFFRKLAEV